METLAPTIQADIDRLLTTVRSDRPAALREIEARLKADDATPSLHHQLLMLKATGHLETGELAPALSTARTVLNWAVTYDETLLAGRTRNMLGLVYWRLGDLPQALEMFETARTNGDAAADSKLVLQATGNMGLVYSALKQWDEAEQVYRRMVKESEGLGDARIIGISTNNLATVLWERHGPVDEALAAARRAFEVKQQFGDTVSIAQTANNIAGILCDRCDFPEARQALDEAEAWVRKAAAKPPAFYLALNRAQFLTSTDNPFRDDVAGFAAFDEAVNIAHETGMLEEEARAHEHAARARAKRDDHARAHAHLEQCIKVREKYLTEQSTRQIERMRQAYEIDRLERENQSERARREELENLNAQLERTGRERDSLLRLIGHDLRTHIGGMLGLGELIHKDLPADGEARENATHLVSLGESTLALLQEIMEHGSALNGAFAEQHSFDLVACLNDVKVRLEPLFAAKHQPFAVELPDGSVPVRSNRSGLGRIVENLLTNAAKFSPAGITTTMRLAEVDGRWEIAIIDRGQGIPPAEVSRLFQPEQRLSVRPTGDEPTTGLGLLLAHDLARIIGVTLAHEPTPGGGATFVVRFPAAPRDCVAECACVP